MKQYLNLLILKIWFHLTFAWRKVRQLLCGEPLGVPMLSGELIVTGKEDVEIELGNRHPKYIVVRFKDHHMMIPCNPKHHDHLKWEVKNHHQSHKHDRRHEHCNHEDRYVLKIYWHVTGVRHISWVVYH